MTLFINKFRVESARLPRWDYSTPGYYFVTICTDDHGCLFGKIVDDEMRLNEYGKIVLDEWIKSFEIRRELKRDEFVIMPNHFHGIVRILDPGDSVETHSRASLQRSEPKQKSEKQQESKLGPQSKIGVAYRSPKSLSSFIAGFKSAATKQINEMRDLPGESVWQPRFHDHIIRNERELFAIRQYIRNNPANWDSDRNVIETMGLKQGKQPWFVYMP